MDNTKINIFHYLILALILLSGLLLLFMYRGKPQMQFDIGMGLTSSYFSWGMIHHYLSGDLHPKIVVEYGLLSVLALLLLKIVLF